MESIVPIRLPLVTLRRITAGLICFHLAVAAVSANSPIQNPAPPAPVYPLWSEDPHPSLRDIETLRAPDGSGTNVRDKRIRTAGNDLIVELVGGPQPQGQPPAALRASSGPGEQPAPATTLAPQQVSRLDLSVDSGKSITMDLDSPINRVSVANPSVADAVVISPEQLLINGIAPGATSLVL